VIVSHGVGLQEYACEGVKQMILIRIPKIPGDSTIVGYDTGDWFVVDSFSFGVQRDMKQSGEKGGTEDINIGVGELKECTIRKRIDRASTLLAQFAIEGNSCGNAEIHFVEVAGRRRSDEAQPVCYLKYVLARCFVKSWSTSGGADDRPTEEVVFYYNKIAFNFAYVTEDTKLEVCTPMAWNKITNEQWGDHGIICDSSKGFVPGGHIG
jgi:type VI protein secretion system component Hcp